MSQETLDPDYYMVLKEKTEPYKPLCDPAMLGWNLCYADLVGHWFYSIPPAPGAKPNMCKQMDQSVLEELDKVDVDEIPRLLAGTDSELVLRCGVVRLLKSSREYLALRLSNGAST